MIELYKNSYVTLETADYYFDERLNSDVWTAADDDAKERALITASRKLDNLNYLGAKQAPDQPMAFPRVFKKGACVPVDIEQAVCEEALALLEGGDSVHARNRALGIQSVNLGSASVTYSEMKQEGLLSSEAYRLASKWVCKGFDISNPEFTEAD